jgi:predicted enzyme related to lactoylglutathione lyase
MQSPIHNRVGMVFIPVSDMPRAIIWYSRLLGLPVGDTSHHGKISSLPMQGDMGVILDSHKAVHNSSQPPLFFWTDDITASWRFLQELEVELLSTVEDIGSVSTLIFRDPDSNLLMVCQSNRPSAG